MGVRDTRKFFGFKILRERERRGGWVGEENFSALKFSERERERRGGWVGEENFSALKFSERERDVVGGCVSRSQLLWEPSLTHRLSSANGFSVQLHIKRATSCLAANPILRAGWTIPSCMLHLPVLNLFLLLRLSNLIRRVCEEQGESLMQRIAAKARSTKKETVVDAAVQEENLPWLAQGQICW